MWSLREGSRADNVHWVCSRQHWWQLLGHGGDNCTPNARGLEAETRAGPRGAQNANERSQGWNQPHGAKVTGPRRATLPAAPPGLRRERGREAARKLRLALRLAEELSQGVPAGKAEWVEGKVRHRWGQTGAGGLGCWTGHPHDPGRSLSAESWCKQPCRRGGAEVPRTLRLACPSPWPRLPPGGCRYQARKAEGT